MGYTNAGKSTLLNTLTDSDVFAEDKLFATLDPTTRHMTLPDGQTTLLTDTVGFIQKLPHHIIAAFRATLDEVIQADLLLHIIDVSHPQFQEQSQIVYQVLSELNVDTRNLITVFNKADKIDNQGLLDQLLQQDSSIVISALSGAGVDRLLRLIANFLKEQTVEISLLIPYSDSSIIAKLYDISTVHSTEYRDEGIYALISLSPDEINRFSAYTIGAEVNE